MRTNNTGNNPVIFPGGIQLVFKQSDVVADPLILEIGPIGLPWIAAFADATILAELILFGWPVSHSEVVLLGINAFMQVVAWHFQGFVFLRKNENSIEAGVNTVHMPHLI